MPRIVEIGDIVRQGRTEPILCRADDGCEYIVKGRYAGNNALISEWVANRLGRVLGLPIPPFCLLDVPGEFFVHGALNDKLSRLGRAPVFGSRLMQNVVELRHTDIEAIDLTLRARVLAFDLWIANSDRVFVNGAGNPNLLWDEWEQKLVVIDHNLAFEPEIMGDFFGEHAFRDAASIWSDSFKIAVATEFRIALSELHVIWNELPEEWLEVECGITFSSVESLLWKFDRDSASFWNLSQ
jgi:hypothetical protein